MEATDGEPTPIHPKEQILFAKIDIILAEEAEFAEQRRKAKELGEFVLSTVEHLPDIPA